MTDPVEITLTVNGRNRRARIEPRRLLADYLRHDLGLTGTHIGCEHGVCGACTVLVDGVAEQSCVRAAGEFANNQITTIEGLRTPNALHVVQDAWIEHQVAQCGYCQSGQIMQAASLLAENPSPSDADIDEAMQGNLCRCGTYPRIRAAIHSAAKMMQEA